MTRHLPFSNTKLDKAMSTEQFEQIVTAILSGKYSWACVLILRFGGYNPLHYIPYRTYNRLLKENCQVGSSNQDKTDSINADGRNAAKSDRLPVGNSLSQIRDLTYLEVMEESRSQLGGGNLEQWLDLKIQEFNSINIELCQPHHKIFSTGNF